MNIQKLKSIIKHEIVPYKNNKLILLPYFHKMTDAFEVENSIIDALIITLVIGGNANLKLGEEKYHLERGDFFACTPNNIISKSRTSSDFEALAICLSSDYCIELADMAKLDWKFRTMIPHHGVIRLDAKQMEMFENIFDFLVSKVKSPDSPNKDKCIDHTLISFICQLIDLKTDIDITEQNYSRQENLLERFSKILNDCNPISQSSCQDGGKSAQGYLSVKEYADLLCITPKYLSATCKRLAGKTAGQIIDENIMTSAKLLLHDNSKSIKQIAEMLGFANQSHFGTFFNRKAGMSPQQFRKSNR